MKVLAVFHTARVSGAERSSLELVRRLRERVELEAACPEGDLAARLRALAIPVHPLPEAAPAARLHPLRTPAGLLALGRAGAALARIARRTGCDVVHATSLRAGLVAAAASRLGAPEPVVEVRDALPAGMAGALARRVLSSSATAFVANSAWTAARFAGPPDVPLHIVHPAVDLERFDRTRTGGSDARDALGIGARVPLLGVVGQLAPWKGQDDAIRTLALVRRSLPQAQLLVVGDAVFAGSGDSLDSGAFARSLPGLAAELGVFGAVRFLGSREDIETLLGALDCLLVPSWAEPFGRIALEGVAAGVPVLATREGGIAEIVEDGVTGLLLPPREPREWAAAVLRVLSGEGPTLSPAARARTVERLGPDRTAQAIEALYRAAAAPSGATAPRVHAEAAP